MEENHEKPQEEKQEEKREEDKSKEKKEEKPTKEKFSLSKTYNKYYKLFFLIPLAFLIFCLFFLVNFSAQHGDIIEKDVTLTGGTTLTVYIETNINELKTSLSQHLDDFSVRGISDIRTGKQIAVIIESSLEPEELKPIVEEVLSITLNDENSSVEFSGSTLSQGFYNQLKLAIIIAFILMAIVVFIIFRNFVPSFAVVLSAFADIIMTVVVIDLLGMKVSTAGVVALLMLIGYSVDTDILLTSRVLKRKEYSVNQRLLSAFKTGVTMTFTSIIAVSIALLIISSYSEVLRQIFTILLIGLGIDLINTWFTNASLLKWYVEKKNK